MTNYPNAYDDSDSLPTVDPGGCGEGGGGEGPQGPQGPTGATGPVGPPGAPGSSGAAGPQGATGPQGSAGSNGSNGATGPQGAAGPQGSAGATGPQGAHGGEVFIYKPGGIATGNTYTSWSLLMAARNLVIGEATIVVDDSITSPAVIPTGTWDLHKNTSIDGYFGNASTKTVLRLNEGGVLNNPYEFKNLTILGNATATPNISIASPFTSIDFTAINTVFKTLSAATASLMVSPRGTITLDGYSKFENDNNGYSIFENSLGSDINFHLNDKATVETNTLTVGGSVNLNIFINSPAASYDINQSGVIVITNTYGANLIGNLNDVSDGYLLSKNGPGTSSWVSPSSLITSGDADTAYLTDGYTNFFDKITDDYIDTSANISFTKLADITTDSLLGRDTAGTGKLEIITLNSTLVMDGYQVLGRAGITGDVIILDGYNTSTVNDLTITSEEQGSILYFNGSNWVQLSPGIDGYTLTTNGVGQNPTWTHPIILKNEIIDFGNTILTLTGATETTTLTGSAVGDNVLANPRDALPDGVSFVARISTADTIEIKVWNSSSGTVDLSATTWDFILFK